MNHKEATEEWMESEYKKNALLNYRKDLLNRLTECANQIAEIDRQMRKEVSAL